MTRRKGTYEDVILISKSKSAPIDSKPVRFDCKSVENFNLEVFLLS